MKIALVGTAEFSRKIAPYGDDSWLIWGHGYWDTVMRRYDAWFDIHNFSNAKNVPGQEKNINFLTDTGKPLYVQAEHPLAPNGVVYPIEKILRLFGDRNATSTTAFMMMLAVLKMRPTLCRTQEPQDRIGLWGVEMVEPGEWRLQREGVMHMLDVCTMMNIQITLPAGSDLRRKPKIYAYEKETGSERKVREYLAVARASKDELEEEGVNHNFKMGVAHGRIAVLEMVARGSLNG